MRTRKYKKVAWITKRHVVEAMRNEPLLIPGRFFSVSENPGCSVCAVGAVMRGFSFEKFLRRHGKSLQVSMMDWLSDGLVGSGGNWVKELSAGRYLNALSVYFEQGHSQEDCVKFVLKNFPTRFKFEGIIEKEVA